MSQLFTIHLLKFRGTSFLLLDRKIITSSDMSPHRKETQGKSLLNQWGLNIESLSPNTLKGTVE